MTYKGQNKCMLVQNKSTNVILLIKKLYCFFLLISLETIASKHISLLLLLMPLLTALSNTEEGVINFKLWAFYL